VSQPAPSLSPDLDSETLFRRHAAFVASFLYRLGSRGADLDDLVQDVFVTAHRRGGYRLGTASPTTFLARLALEARLSSRRRERRWRDARHDELASSAMGLSPVTPDRALAVSEAARQLQHALERMSPDARAVFVLFELDGESCEAIAAGLEIKLGTVYSRLHNARKAFTAELARAARVQATPMQVASKPP
jgi:RNA polymerase sigma-70 factor (ECF subfamily)